jgi:hypothetical protein
LLFGIIPYTLAPPQTIVHRIILPIVIILTLPVLGLGESFHHGRPDRLWVVSTRTLSSDACRASLDCPALQIRQLDHCGRSQPGGIDEFLGSLSVDQPVLFQVHGNRMTAETAIERGVFVYNQVVPHCDARPLDFVIFSWPSEQQGFLLNDGREKAGRTDAEGLYFAWLLRELVQRDIPITIIGFSFGGRVATGALHALAGGPLGGRTLPGQHHRGANVNLGLIAPALEDDWLKAGSYHGLATQNFQRLSILYNRRDAVLKRYWLIDKVRGNMALGFTGPKGVGFRFDGTPMPITANDCSTTLGIKHDEKKYYLEDCSAGYRMAKLLELSY